MKTTDFAVSWLLFKARQQFETEPPPEIWPAVNLAMMFPGQFRSRLLLKIFDRHSVRDNLTFGSKHRIR
ncbi:hypothetical protein HED50_05465 [Ochrobactrum oryzae]|nr:hypothetical protein [Brucella oryzae]